MKRFLLITFSFLLIISFNSQSPIITSSNCEISVCFSPSQRCTSRIVNLIDKSKKEIDVAMFSFTSRKIARALIRAKRRGVKVRVIIDEGTARASHCVLPVLVEEEIEAKVKRGSGGGLMHNKFAVIDESCVITGSFNWTVSAQKRNDENLLIIKNRDLAKRYREKFQELWELANLEE